MMSKASRRRMVLLGLLAVAAWLAIFGDKTPVGVVRARGMETQELRATPAPAPEAASARRPPAERIEPLASRDGWFSDPAATQADLFARGAWHEPETKPMAAPAPAAQASIPVPLPSYRVVGKKQDGEQWEVFLMRDETSFVVRQGQVLESAWRVDHIEPPNMTITHVPSGQEHRLAIGEAL